jgi:HK97 family phage major capsid protein
MEEDISVLGKEIARMERAEALDNEMNSPINKPITAKPEKAKVDTKTGRASDAYKKAFWDVTRKKEVTPEMKNTLNEGSDTEGGYLVPDEFENKLVTGLKENTVIRAHAHVITTSGGLHKIPVVASHGSASWIDEEGAYTESDETFGQVQLDAHKVGTIIKVSEELLNDSAFDLENYIAEEFTRRIGDKEEEAFLTGNGTGKPTGILNATGGGQVGVTTASATAITADELIDLYYSLKAPYRKKAIWVLNDTTIKAIRKLKDSNGNYLLQPALKDGEVSTILGRPYFTSAYAPEIAAGAKTILFGDLSYYWIGDRQGISFKRLNERYADNGQIGFLAFKRLDGKTVLPEAIKVLQQHA